MIVQTFAGFINPDAILQHTHIETWALAWLNRAQKAAATGKELVVFEIPKKELPSQIRELVYHAVQFALDIGLDPGLSDSDKLSAELLAPIDD